MKKLILILLILLLTLPIFSKNDPYDISFGFGHYSNFENKNDLMVYFGSTIGLTNRLETTFGISSEITPNIMGNNILQAGLSYALMGNRSTSSKVAGSSINTLINVGVICETRDFIIDTIYLSITPLTVGSPIHKRRERVAEIGLTYNYLDNRFGILFSMIKLDYFVRGTQREYLQEL